MRILNHIRQLHRREDGGAYTLAYVMVIPFIMLFICLVVETTLMLSAKLGTVYAGFAAARSVSVWHSATDETRATSRMEYAAQKAFVPFASGLSRGQGTTNEPPTAQAFDDAYREYISDPASEGYVKRKFADATDALRVKIESEPSDWDSDIAVAVEYDFPFRVPGIGRLLGKRSSTGDFVYTLKTQVTLQNEAPQNRSQDLGIGYGTVE